jgi:ATP-dependent Clp protease ATP-binding subunit ClpC
MFERYTDPARRTIFSARMEAARQRSEYIETQHLLMGILAVAPQSVTPFLSEQVSTETLRSELTQMWEAPKVGLSSSVDIPLSEKSKRVLAYAAEDADSLGHRHIGTEHLLLGLLHDDNDASRLLRQYGVDREKVSQVLVRNEPNTAQLFEGKASREDLHKLIDTLPDGAMDTAANTLRHLQVCLHRNRRCRLESLSFSS